MDKKVNETIGRLWLWKETLSMTKHLLEMAFRANIGKQDRVRLQEHEIYNVKLQEFAIQQSNYIKGITFPSHRKAFDEIYSRPFPTWLECCSIHDAFIELAIVYFCQLFNSGQSQIDEAANNDKKFINEHLTNVLKIILSTDEERKRFELLKNNVLIVRNKVIGHSDANTYSITHGNPISVLKGPNITWRDIDLEFWYSFLDRMINAVQHYSNQLKIEANLIPPA